MPCWITQISLGATSIIPNSVVIFRFPVCGTVKCVKLASEEFL